MEKQKGNTHPLIHHMTSQVMMHCPELPMLNNVCDLLYQGWKAISERERNRHINDLMHGIEEAYFECLKEETLSLQRPEAVEELGPYLKLQALFNIVNNWYDQAMEHLYSVGCEFFRNLGQLDDLATLDDIDLGTRGIEFYESLVDIAVEEGADWQVFAASVYFRCKNPWILTTMKVEEAEGSGRSASSSDDSSDTERDAGQYQKHFSKGLVARYPGLDESTIEDVFRAPEALFQDSYLEAIQSTNERLRSKITKFILDRVEQVEILGPAVHELHRFVQRRLEALALMEKAALEDERLTPHELKQLLEYLIDLPKTDLQDKLAGGLRVAL